MSRYDVLIVGAGPFGATAAALLHRAGKRVLVVERRPHVAGNCYDEMRDEQRVNTMGGHIFHTNSEAVWAFVQAFGDWTPIQHRKYARVGRRLYAFPISLMTLHQLWGVCTPDEARTELERRRTPQADPAASLETWCLHTIGPELYELFVKGYTEKMWGQSCASLPASIWRRIPVRTTYDDRYFEDRWEAVPTNGYTALVEAMLEGCEVRLGVDYLKERDALDALAPLLIYSGPLDAFFGYEYGKLTYRSLAFAWGHGEQGALTVNYPAADVPHIRTTEFRYLWNRGAAETPLLYETPTAYDDPAQEALYPVRDAENDERARRYRALPTTAIIGGRLGDFQYYNMDQVIASAMKIVRGILT